ncbi:glycine cleavage system aminomethyltransferase GcvT [Halalkalicoccus jeotgali]|uniref:Probable aminomethyltransferase n=1 Tax=Halalkalicoccus jeotgali (strain DSM 18796 / CECT 7217 / JCM 14584 / KCTC 4019 / B3) TaxID=795797 RepID=D8JAL8_HALJB|nr:glycine cleavage system aminomethyltransferase GcvT [Halalkalicoccus jeotgali]ADJ14740.1 glycine cleavage system aminomethyltransferase T [Halalkalicoccus jeotgali B3]ELY39322.1 glycine cleavage system aminomethyltransferase T [Halalkalicoccus jeotgali B3]
MSEQEPPLYTTHEERGAKFTPFGGWAMPVEFDSIRTEHEAVRESAGIFDVSHMGEIEVSGPDAATLLQGLTTNDVESLSVGRAQYSTITNEEGVILDDTVIYRLAEEEFLFIPNAGHDGEMEERWVEHRAEWDLDCAVENRTDEWAMFAIQGPDAAALVSKAAGEGLRDLSRFSITRAEVAGTECLFARTGYTGEDGYEALVPWDGAEGVWEEFDCQPCGLGARDTLRIEAGFLLSGQDFHSEENPRNPYEARVGFTVDLDTEFVGRDALARVDENGPEELFVGIRLEERGIPRQCYEIRADGEPVGEVTSGTMSPTLGEPIGLGYVPTDYAEEGTEVAVRIRGTDKRARIEAPGFLGDR